MEIFVKDYFQEVRFGLWIFQWSVANQIGTLSKAEKPFSNNCFVRETDFTGLIILMLPTVLHIDIEFGPWIFRKVSLRPENKIKRVKVQKNFTFMNILH